MRGVVNWFGKDYGWIGIPDQPDIYFHRSHLQTTHISRGDEVEFKINVDRKSRRRAVRVRVIARDVLTGFEITEDTGGRFKARKGKTVIYGESIDQIRRSVKDNPGFLSVNAGLKSCDELEDAGRVAS